MSGPRKISRSAAVMIAMTLARASIYATDRHVGSGQTYSTIPAAITAASAGDRIVVHAGTYSGTVTVSKNNLTIEANTGETPTINGKIENSSATGTTIRNLNITNWGTAGAGTWAIHCDGADQLTIEGNTIFDGWGLGIYLRNCQRSVISGNTVHHCKNAGADGTGISLFSAHSNNGTYANGVQVLNNIVHDNETDGINGHGQYLTFDGNTIYSNITTDWLATHPDGIQMIYGTIDGYADFQHLRITRNTIYNHTQNIFIEGGTPGNGSLVTDVLIANNVVYTESGTVNGVNLDAITMTGIMVKYIKDATVANNTVGRHGGGGVHFQGCGDAGMIFKNNLITTAIGYGMYNEDTAAFASGACNYNLYYNNTTVAVKWGSTPYTSRANFHTAVAAQETNGLDGNPSLNADFTIPSSSLAKDAGMDATGLGVAVDRILTVRPQGAAFDIGAYEYASGGPASYGSRAGRLSRRGPR